MMKRCDRKRSDMTPCVITDGADAYSFESDQDTHPICVGCGRSPQVTGVAPPADWAEQVADYLKAVQIRHRR
ncbi:hypothetical protein QA639_09870 [Bradyrhizobium pachyrhizi]|uniref:hypothetical protein n=2 Tax=Nitrobacteraceae TaxID=41294 RepID=UPI00067DCE82|nr:hypothetical protein [Bradyrhizobium pachyrhizi]WFU57780.1 hypothetical protein QA639_09870 [Bradyrhizobium pachyrhizi]